MTTMVVMVYDNWLKPLYCFPYHKLEQAKRLCQAKGFFLQLEKDNNLCQIRDIPDDKGDYRGIAKQKKQTHSLARGELDNPSWELLVKLDEEKTKRYYPPAGEFVIPEQMKATDETVRSFNKTPVKGCS